MKMKLKNNDSINILAEDMKDVISQIADICTLAQNHHYFYFDSLKSKSREEHIEEYGDVDMHYIMETTSFICACYIAQFIDSSVETEVLQDELSSSLKSRKKWKKIIKKTIKEYMS